MAGEREWWEALAQAFAEETARGNAAKRMMALGRIDLMNEAGDRAVRNFRRELKAQRKARRDD